MGFIEKIEDAINRLLLLIWKVILQGLSKIIPSKINHFIEKTQLKGQAFIILFKNSPKTILAFCKKNFLKTKEKLSSANYKQKFIAIYQEARAKYAPEAPSRSAKLKYFLLSPFILIGQWLSGLTSTQAVMLLGFTAASALAVVNVIFSGHRLLEQAAPKELRSPANVEDEIRYERPEYYKMQTRHLELSSVRLPVYFANVNELRTVDIDFIATLSNRLAKMKLDKLEFQLRDHLILQIEPMIANSPLIDEGKEIIRAKLIIEINGFLKLHQIEGEIADLKLTYILAN